MFHKSQPVTKLAKRCWLVRGWNETSRAKKKQKMESRPFTQYHIASAHNAFLENYQITWCCCGKKKGRVEPLWDALLAGARMVELDIHTSPKSGNIVVAHGTTWDGVSLLASPEISIDRALSTVLDFLEKYPNTFPVLLELEIASSVGIQKLRPHLAVFGDRLATGVQFHRDAPAAFRGKVILTGRYDDPLFSPLEKMEWYRNVASGVGRADVSRTAQRVRDEFQLDPQLVVRVYPENILLSKNFEEWQPLVDAGCQFVSMNYGVENDPALDAYIAFFTKNLEMVGYVPMKHPRKQ